MLGERPSLPSLVGHRWDLVVVGGGITGAGIALEAARLGQKVLLLEQQDFAWGTSSRSSKMVHGGLRYLAQGDIRLTRDSLRERERLLRELPELVARKTYLFPVHRGKFPGRWGMAAALWLYDLLAGIRDHRWLPLASLRQREPDMNLAGITGAMTYTDALTDDSRLVLRVLHEATSLDAKVVNYVRASAITATSQGFDLQVTEQLGGGSATLQAKRVINATGAFADQLSGSPPRVRPQRGSHLFFSAKRLPVNDCLTLMHPEDGRPVFLFPWQGCTCVGTTDLDHRQPLAEEASVTTAEVDYLLALIRDQFPKRGISAADILACMAGVRPIISSGKGVDPSKERRDHAIWEQDGVITVSGGKLTTFRLIALDALLAAGLLSQREHKQRINDKRPIFHAKLPYALGNPLVSPFEVADLDAQVAWILANEQVVHLDDLLLRRTRLGLLLPAGGKELMPGVERLCHIHLHWDDVRWQQEQQRYFTIIQRYYQPPTGAGVAP